MPRYVRPVDCSCTAISGQDPSGFPMRGSRSISTLPSSSTRLVIGAAQSIVTLFFTPK